MSTDEVEYKRDQGGYYSYQAIQAREKASFEKGYLQAFDEILDYLAKTITTLELYTPEATELPTIRRCRRAIQNKREAAFKEV